jgi:hypothetical protein
MATLEDQLEHAVYKNKLLEDNMVEVIRENDMIKEEAEQLRLRAEKWESALRRMEDGLQQQRPVQECPNCDRVRQVAHAFVEDNARFVEATEQSLG